MLRHVLRRAVVSHSQTPGPRHTHIGKARGLGHIKVVGKETRMLHVTPRAPNGQRAKLAAKEVCGAKTRASRKKTYAHACRTRMSHDAPAGSRCRVATKPPPPHARLHPLSTQVQRRKPNERAWRAGKEKDRDTQQSGGRGKGHVREKGRGKGKEQRSHKRNKG